MICRAATLSGLLYLCAVTALAGTSTSTYLGNAQRTAYVDAVIPATPVLHWVYHERQLPRHAWPEPNREVQYIDFDYATQVVIADGAVFFGSSADHKVYSIDLATGAEKWTFYTEGPVRFAPVFHDGRVYVASDDGHLYCRQAATGEEVWRRRGGPTGRKLIGNEQMISHWPARSGVLIVGDRLYFTAGMWSRDGVFIYCLDPADGTVIWKNDTSGYHFATLPHSTGFAGVAPQGYLALHRDRLYVPTGRGAPAAFDASTGEFQFYENGLGYKPHQPGGSRVMAYRDWVIFKRRSQHSEESVRYETRDPARGAASGLFAISYDSGKVAWSLTDRNIVAARDKSLILAGQGPVIKADIDDLMAGYEKFWKAGKNLGHDKNIEASGVDYTKSSRGKLIPNPAWMSPLPYKQWQADVGRVFVLLCVGDTILAGGRERVSAIDFQTGDVLWQKPVEGDARGICAVDGRFIVSTTAGRLYCFGGGDADSDREITRGPVKPAVDEFARQTAKEIVEESGVRAGYALMVGAGDGKLLSALIDESDLVVYCLEPDAEKVAALRKTLDDAGLLGVRAAIHHGPFDPLPYNPYFADLIVWGDRLGGRAVMKLDPEELYRVLRPCGGVAVYLPGSAAATNVGLFLQRGGIPADEIDMSSLWTVVRRGKLPGGGEWTHPHANIGRTGCSEDRLARLPLGMLWWGGPGPSRIVSRHWRAPSPLFANGVLYVQGQHDVFAVDAYNGREMWNRHLPRVGRFPPTHRGGNIVADDEGVYCIQGLTCLKLDAQTGKTIRQYTFPLTAAHRAAMADLLPEDAPAEDIRIVWEYLGLTGDYLLGTLGQEPADEQKAIVQLAKSIQQSKIVFAFSRTTGELLWQHALERSVSPTAIVADGQTIYLLDRTGGAKYDAARRRGAGDEQKSSLKALDLSTGDVLWTTTDVPPAWKALMLRKDVVVAYPNPAENPAGDGDKGVGVFACGDGRLLWKKDTLKGVSETGRGGTMRHTFIVGDTLFLPWAFDLHTGEERLLETHPLTGRPERFNVSGKNFCGTFSAACDLLIYRSASIGFAEISRDSGSYWLPESRPSCWISAIPVGGMVLAPEGYSTCICPYNYKTSLAMIPVERNENWSVYLAGGRREKMAVKAHGKQRGKYLDSLALPPRAIRSLRVNINAPGDQMDTHGKLWLAWPRPVDPKRVYFIQPVPLQQESEASSYRLNSDQHAIAGTPTSWLYTSGLTGPLKFTVHLAGDTPDRYDVTLHFAETESVAVGQRVFNVKIQDQAVVSDLDIVAASGGQNRALVKAFKNIRAEEILTVELVPVRGEPPLICAMEILRQD